MCSFLPALNVTNLVSFKLQRQQCNKEIGNDFRFKEIPADNSNHHDYSYEHRDSGMYLTCSCDRGRLTLIQSKHRSERKISFTRYKVE